MLPDDEVRKIRNQVWAGVLAICIALTVAVVLWVRTLKPTPNPPHEQQRNLHEVADCWRFKAEFLKLSQSSEEFRVAQARLHEQCPTQYVELFGFDGYQHYQQVQR